jgi:N-acetylglucosamine-6-phosphate deacetylase
MLIRNALVFNKYSEFEYGDIRISGDRISEVLPNICIGDSDKDAYRVIDATGLMAIPGLVDIHFHGAVGHDFCEADIDGLKEIAEYELKHGITSICPATMTYPEDKLKEIASRARNFCDEPADPVKYAELVGINMEGPFISEKKIGAQNPKYVQRPDGEMFERLQKESGNLIKLVDIAPEVDGAIDFIEKYHDKVKISVAHTDADYDAADRAFKAGADHVTHLYNAMNSIHHRNPGPVIAALENGAEVELIADGVHVHPAMVRFTFNSFGAHRVILISDSMEATGLSDGQYQLGGQAVIKKGKLATLKDSEGVVAGSVTNLFDCMKNAVLNMGVDLEDAITAATVNPARSIGIDGDCGSIEKGKYADILLVNEKLEIKYVIKKGVIAAEN